MKEKTQATKHLWKQEKILINRNKNMNDEKSIKEELERKAKNYLKLKKI